MRITLEIVILIGYAATTAACALDNDAGAPDDSAVYAEAAPVLIAPLPPTASERMYQGVQTRFQTATGTCTGRVAASIGSNTNGKLGTGNTAPLATETMVAPPGSARVACDP